MNLKADLKLLKAQAYHRAEWGSMLIRKIHRLPSRVIKHPNYPFLKKLRLWLLSPVTLWPINLDMIGHRLIDALKTGKLLDSASALALEILTDPPSETAQAVVSEHEHDVQRGNYEHLIHAEHKFRSHLEEYCKRDTMGMIQIIEHLREVTA